MKSLGFDWPALQRHNTENSKQILPEKELRGLSQFPNSCVSAAGKYVDGSWEYINRSQTHECGNWDWGHTISFLGIHEWDFRCSTDLPVKQWFLVWTITSPDLANLCRFSAVCFPGKIYIGTDIGKSSSRTYLNSKWHLIYQDCPSNVRCKRPERQLKIKKYKGN